MSQEGKSLLSQVAETFKTPLSGNSQTSDEMTRKADTSGPAISQSPAGGLINAAGVEGFDKKYKGPAVLASGEQVPATGGYNAVGEPMVKGDDGKNYRASDTTHS